MISTALQRVISLKFRATHASTRTCTLQITIINDAHCVEIEGETSTNSGGKRAYL